MCTLSGSSLTASQSTGLKWRTQPTPQTVEAGNSVSFTCLAEFSKKIQGYDWERNNLPLPDDDRFIRKNGGQTLEISQTKFEDRGDYRCVVTRKDKVLGESQSAALNVKGTCDTMLLSRNLGRSFFVPELLAPLSLSEIYLACFHFFLRGVRIEVLYNRLLACCNHSTTTVYHLAKRRSKVDVVDLCLILPKINLSFVPS